jgi:hypothetical protein
LLNYAREPVAQPVRLTLNGTKGTWGPVAFAVPLENRPWTTLAAKAPTSDAPTFELPAFRDYLAVKIALSDQSGK